MMGSGHGHILPGTGVFAHDIEKEFFEGRFGGADFVYVDTLRDEPAVELGDAGLVGGLELDGAVVLCDVGAELLKVAEKGGRSVF